MRRSRVLVVGVFVVVTAPDIARAQSSSIAAAQLHASVDIDSKGVFVYRYTVANGARSTAAVWKLTIDIKGGGKGEAAPVELSTPQPGWAATIGADSTARWVATRDGSLIAPARRLSGFSIASHGPPSLRRFVLSPHVDADQAPIMPPGDDPGDLDRYNHDLDRYVDSRGVAGITLAPAAPVAAITEAWFANLGNQVEQARSLGWIATDIARNVRAKLDAARVAASRRQRATAENLLRELRKELAAQSGKNLTSEALALIDLNIQYALQLTRWP